MNANKIILIIFLTIFFCGCAKKESETQLSWPQSYSETQMQILFLRDIGFCPIMPDTDYQVVNSKSLNSFYEKYKKELFDKGVVNWRESFDCNRYSLYYHALAQITFYTQTAGENKAESIAIGELYYISKKQGAHAVNFAYTEKGLLFIEPQTGEIIRLNKDEISSIIYIKM